jgi:hypothetical protein
MAMHGGRAVYAIEDHTRRGGCKEDGDPIPETAREAAALEKVHNVFPNGLNRRLFEYQA